MILESKMPALIETMSYRGGDHSSSDASANYRNEQEMTKWGNYLEQIGNPIARFENFLVGEKIIGEDFQNPKTPKPLNLELKSILSSGLFNCKIFE